MKRILIFTLVLFIIWLCFMLFANYSEGVRTGYIVKISKKGYIFKTYEGELNFGFPQVNTIPGANLQNIWHFSVPDKSVAEQIEKSSELGQIVSLYYKQKYIKLFFIGDTEYFVYRVEPSSEMMTR
ncbi:MAG: 6-phosphogluconate dehydrogenase [Saprospiraceae bacterium]|nr:6-phosphogluconate dehydrogenase [Saprospiraceae bacterium]